MSVAVTMGRQRTTGRARRKDVVPARRSARLECGPIGAIQRARILAGMTQVACERGAGNVTVSDVVKRAGVSRRTFYDAFDDSEDCFLAALDQAIDYVAEQLLAAWRAPGRWQERIRACLAELLAIFDEQPYLGRLLVVESLGGRARALQRRSQALEGLIVAVDAARDGARAGTGATGLTAEGIVGAVLSVIHARIVSGSRGRLMELLNPLMGMIVLPYFGAAAARRELDRALPPPRTVAGTASLLSDPFKEAGMRLTWRTTLVLRVIAAEPGLSNRQIGRQADVNDQGQISKLLARLERLGLIANVGGRAKGDPNAWTLTPKGEEVERRIGAHTKALSSTTQGFPGRE